MHYNFPGAPELCSVCLLRSLTQSVCSCTDTTNLSRSLIFSDLTLTVNFMLMKYCRVHAYMRHEPQNLLPESSLSLREKFVPRKIGTVYRFDSETKGTTEFRNPKVLGL